MQQKSGFLLHISVWEEFTKMFLYQLIPSYWATVCSDDVLFKSFIPVMKVKRILAFN
jgi:hypothetical protein